MEFDFNVEELLHADENGFAVLDAYKPPMCMRAMHTNYGSGSFI